MLHCAENADMTYVIYKNPNTFADLCIFGHKKGLLSVQSLHLLHQQSLSRSMAQKRRRHVVLHALTAAGNDAPPAKRPRLPVTSESDSSTGSAEKKRACGVGLVTRHYALAVVEAYLQSCSAKDRDLFQLRIRNIVANNNNNSSSGSGSTIQSAQQSAVVAPDDGKGSIESGRFAGRLTVSD